jgi:hypothetical protein
VTWADVTTYLIAAVPAVVLYGAYALFRWLYIRALERVIYAPAGEAPLPAPASSLSGTSERSIRWVDASEWARRPEPAGVTEARREAAAVRRAYAVAGAVFVLLGGMQIHYGLMARDMTWRAASVIAALSTFVGLALILMFVRPRLRVVLLTIALWVACYFALAVGIVRTSWKVAADVLLSNITFTMSLSFLLIGPFALRTMRPLVVAFVPIVALVIVLTTGTMFAFDLFELELPVAGEFTVRSVLGGMVAFALGVALVVHQIRREMHALFVVGWLAATAATTLVAWYSGSLLAAFVNGVFVNGTFVLVSWAVLRLFLRLKARGHLPSETLHYTGCWVLYAVAIAPVAQLGWSLLPAHALAFAVYLAVLYTLLLHGRQPERLPRRMLLLRVFKQTPIRSWLMDLLDDTWRRIGRVDTVVGLDLALHTLNAFALEDFLRGRVRRQFLKTSAEVQERIAALPATLSVDRRYPLNELHCLPETWRQAVTTLLDAADVVLIDLRGVQPANRGVLYELALAVRRVPLQRLVLIADARTNASLVAQAAAAADAASTLDVLALNASADVNARAVANAVFAAAA